MARTDDLIQPADEHAADIWIRESKRLIRERNDQAMGGVRCESDEEEREYRRCNAPNAKANATA